jgi:sulfur-oxidizing protein SoxA
MLSKTVKMIVVLSVATCFLYASDYNTQAEKDRKALSKYTVDKFKNPSKNMDKFFPYSTKKELRDMKKNLKSNDFKNGTYAFDMIGKVSRDDMMEMPPFEDNVEKGKKAYEKSFKQCFPRVDIAGEYPMFDEKSQKVITLSEAIVSCAKDKGLKTGKKGYNLKSGKTADLQAYFASVSQENSKKVNIKINSKSAQNAYEHGKKEFYSQRGYLSLSCATCHVQGAGQRVRLQYLSQTLGHVTHFPVYRTGKGKLFTLEGRLGGCNRNMGEKPHKASSDWSSDVLYFMAYMSNGMDLSGPDVRR